MSFRVRRRGGWAMIAWAPYSRRSEMFARELDGTLHCIHYLKFQSPAYAPLKYVLQTVRTLWVLFRDRPSAVHVQNPPFVCGLVVDLYRALTGARYVIEHHSAAFGPAWDWALPAQKLLARHAVTNIATNEHWASLIRSWDAHALVMYDPFLELPQVGPYPLEPGVNVAFLGTFAADEPVQAVLGAAALLPEIHFHVTGETTRVPELVAAAPANVSFTGFLDSNREYLGLLRGVDAVIVLTTRDHTLQLAGCEAIAVGKPLVTSDFPYLRELFAAGAVFVEPSAESIAAGVRDAVDRASELAAEIPRFRDQQRAEWNARLRQLEAMVSGGAEGTDDGNGRHARASEITRFTAHRHEGSGR